MTALSGFVGWVAPTGPGGAGQRRPAGGRQAGTPHGPEDLCVGCRACPAIQHNPTILRIGTAPCNTGGVWGLWDRCPGSGGHGFRGVAGSAGPRPSRRAARAEAGNSSGPEAGSASRKSAMPAGTRSREPEALARTERPTPDGTTGRKPGTGRIRKDSSRWRLSPDGFGQVARKGPGARARKLGPEIGIRTGILKSKARNKGRNRQNRHRRPWLGPGRGGCRAGIVTGRATPERKSLTVADNAMKAATDPVPFMKAPGRSNSGEGRAAKYRGALG